MRTVWIVGKGETAPRLVTAYPLQAIMINEHDRVVLKTDVESERLLAGDVGTVVHVYKDREAYEVEFLTLKGETVTVTTLEASQVRPIEPREIAHARALVKT